MSHNPVTTRWSTLSTSRDCITTHYQPLFRYPVVYSINYRQRPFNKLPPSIMYLPAKQQLHQYWCHIQLYALHIKSHFEASTQYNPLSNKSSFCTISVPVGPWAKTAVKILYILSKLNKAKYFLKTKIIHEKVKITHKYS